MSEFDPQAGAPSFWPYADGFAVGQNTLAYITRMRVPVEAGETPKSDLLAGDVLRRTCALGGTACAQSGCQAPEGYDNTDKLCSDLNLKDITRRLNISPDDLLVVGVTADSVGFYDQLESYDNLKTNSVGIRELPGYNAFFAKASAGVVLGARLADCGFAAVEFQDGDGEDIIGFAHLTRPNLQGESKLGFAVDGQPAGCFEYFLHQALRHYRGDIDSVKVHLIASTKSGNIQYTFKDKGPSELFPGWYEQGLLLNTTNPAWKPGDTIDPKDIWEPQYDEMVRYHILRSGIRPEQFSQAGMIDPADLELGHASNHAGAHGKMPDARDAYLVMPRSALKS